VGRFTVKETDDGEILTTLNRAIKAGDWVKQGYPYYSGTGVYTFSVEFDRKPVQATLNLNAVSDCADVEVNGKRAGGILWEPYSIDITPYLTEGNNNITIKVSNSLYNFIEYGRKPSGLTEGARIEYFL
jgi:hypothetical protein